jgi:hypothetical protein
MMKLIGVAFAVVGLCGLTLAAQEIKTTTKEKTKIEIKDGKDVKVVGCVDRSLEGRYVLTHDGGALRYVLVTDDNLTKYVGRLVEVKGLATDRGDAKVKIEQETGTTGTVAGEKRDESKTSTTTKIEGDVGMPYLGVKSIKRLADSCK